VPSVSLLPIALDTILWIWSMAATRLCSSSQSDDARSPVPPKVPTTPGAPPNNSDDKLLLFCANSKSESSCQPIRSNPTRSEIGRSDVLLIQSANVQIPDDFAKISPEGLTALLRNQLSGANIQKLNLEGRLDDIRNGSNGFNSTVKMNGGSLCGSGRKKPRLTENPRTLLEPVTSIRT